ncbi:unnamed protein product, partial [Mesorhabditis spiculigera]
MFGVELLLTIIHVAALAACCRTKVPRKKPENRSSRVRRGVFRLNLKSTNLENDYKGSRTTDELPSDENASKKVKQFNCGSYAVLISPTRMVSYGFEKADRTSVRIIDLEGETIGDYSISHEENEPIECPRGEPSASGPQVRFNIALILKSIIVQGSVYVFPALVAGPLSVYSRS